MAHDSTETKRKLFYPYVFSRSYRFVNWWNQEYSKACSAYEAQLLLRHNCFVGSQMGEASCFAENMGQDTRILTRKSLEPSGIVLSAATSLWLPVTQQRLFEFLCDGQCRNQWDILSNGASMENMLLVPKGQHEGSCVSFLRAAGKDRNESSMLILQETWNNISGALVVYVPSMNVVMSGGDSAYVALLPSGFSILPDGSSSFSDHTNGGGVVNHEIRGCLLTVGFQILVNSLPTAKLNVESVETVNNLIACTIHKIRAALGIPA